MCGIAGILNLNGEDLGEDARYSAKMASLLTHRGPDDEGSMAEGPVSFSFRRLSIIDLETGHQPLRNQSETVWVMFNGEIYNYIELRKDLQKLGYSFRTKSDTEVIVHAYEHYGLQFVNHLRGMFAIALWDSRRRSLMLVRDRIGKKPLFYSVRGSQLAFASEIKALKQWPLLDRSIDPVALDRYLSYLYVPGPHAIFENVQKLLPGHILTANCYTGRYSIRRYWQVDVVPDYRKSLAFYAEGLKEVIGEAVRIRLHSDVPIGAFLSGGIDSTIVVGLMARDVSPLQTFNIGFSDKRFDETGYAQSVASAFATKHHWETFDSTTFSPEELAKLVWYMDEPFGDSSFIPTYWLARITRKYVTVALSGDGGDELFAGYSRYRHFLRLKRLGWLPYECHWMGKTLVSKLRTLAGNFSPAVSEQLRKANKALELSKLEERDQIQALQTYFDGSGKNKIYSEAWRNNVLNSHEELEQNGRFEGVAKIDKPLVRFMASDLEAGMIDDGLVKVDRASMACSLEVRSPFLDHHVIEFAMKIPPRLKVQGRDQKVVLKEAFKDLLPPTIKNRKKQGFEVPFANWFQEKSWRSLIMDTLSETRLRRQGIFNPDSVCELRDQIMMNPEARNLAFSAYQLRHRVWALLMFQLWHDQFLN